MPEAMKTSPWKVLTTARPSGRKSKAEVNIGAFQGLATGKATSSTT